MTGTSTDFDVLVIGAGNSGMQLVADLAEAGQHVTLAAERAHRTQPVHLTPL
ncbi:MAG: Pyridine nucleotide-disulfide oxidoreductase [Frankiales bacterium]|nr:Pyridine nucleotide-disulfide oxidoreductase [Frankiales bacterium]